MREVPKNPDPDPISYDDARQIMQTFVRRLWKAETTLSAIDESGVFSNIRVTETIVKRWHASLDELEALLDGDKLVPFWRGSTERQGINMRRVFTEPRDLDLAAWMQGTAATPYLEPGDLTDQGVWQRLQTAFGGQMMTFFVWFN